MIPGNVVSNNDGAEVLEVLYAAINVGSGDTDLVAAVTDKKIRVISFKFLTSAATAVRFESGAGGTALTGIENYPANGGNVAPWNPGGWFETAAGQSLSLETDGDVDGCLSYVLAD